MARAMRHPWEDDEARAPEAESWECRDPEACVIQGIHLRDECHTAKEREAQQEGPGSFGAFVGATNEPPSEAWDVWQDDVMVTPEEMQRTLKTRLVLDGCPDLGFMETARDDEDSWWIQEWETFDVDGATYWRACSGIRVLKSVVAWLATVQEHHPPRS
jgi:hypothetical protein